MGKTGLEPVRDKSQGILNPLRLPIPPLALVPSLMWKKLYAFTPYKQDINIIFSTLSRLPQKHTNTTQKFLTQLFTTEEDIINHAKKIQNCAFYS